MADRWHIAGPGYVLVRSLPSKAQTQFKDLMREVRKDPEHCPLARRLKGIDGFYAPFGEYTAAFEIRSDANLIWVSHVAAIDLKRSMVHSKPEPSPDPPSIL